MSILSIGKSEIIPNIESDIFIGHEASQFAVGIVAVGSEIVEGRESEYHGYSLLRGNTYAYEKHFMTADELNPDGTEEDEDDNRSVHFAVIENAIRSPRVIATMRLIIKGRDGLDGDGPLPIEHHYPEAFASHAPQALSTEVSRFISRHEDPRVQKMSKWPLFSVGVSYALKNQLGPIYGAVEDVFARGLSLEGVPVKSMAEAKFVPEFNASKLPIEINLAELSQNMREGKTAFTGYTDLPMHDLVYYGKRVSGAAGVALAV